VGYAVGQNGADGSSIIGPQGEPGISYTINWMGTWNSGQYYQIGDGVEYNGSSFYCTVAQSGNTPNPGGSYGWAVLAVKGDSGANGVDGANNYYYSTTPGGSSGDIQYNNGSNFAGDSAFTYNGTNLILSSGRGIQTNNFAMNGLSPSGTVSVSANGSTVSGSDYASEYSIINDMRNELSQLKQILKDNFGMINYWAFNFGKNKIVIFQNEERRRNLQICKDR